MAGSGVLFLPVSLRVAVLVSRAHLHAVCLLMWWASSARVALSSNQQAAAVVIAVLALCPDDAAGSTDSSRVLPAGSTLDHCVCLLRWNLDVPQVLY